MAKIHELTENLTNQIAAGEVIERPASVVKELIENSIDAGSTRIRIQVGDSGLKEIIVQDNGTGIERDDLDLAFMRHATSKISNEHDLFNIATLGFRGEALASISAVAHVEILTSTDGKIGVRAQFAGGKKILQEDAGSARGTKITVRDLFYNTPARLKYLKSPRTELMKIIDIVNRIALGHPKISISLTNNGKNILRTSGNGNLKQDIANIYGRHIAEKMLEISNSDNDFKVKGLISEPELTRSNRNFISILLNGRYIKNYQLASAVMDGYGNKLGSKHYPIAVVTIDVDPLLVDVNVHPTKEEVRLSKETELSRLITSAVSTALMSNQESDPLFKLNPYKKQTHFDQLQFNLNKDVVNTKRPDDFSTENVNNHKTKKENTKSVEMVDSVSEKPIVYVSLDKPRDDQRYLITETWDQNVLEQQKLAPFSDQKENIDQNVVSKSDIVLNSNLPSLNFLGQMKNYILAENNEDLYLIDQVAARRRISYDQIVEKISNEGSFQQGLLEPIVLDFGPLDHEKLLENISDIKTLGIYLEDFGRDSFILRTYPTWLHGNLEREIRELLETYLNSENESQEKVLKIIAAKMAKNNNPSRINLTNLEASQLISNLRKTSDPYRDADGRISIVKLNASDLNKLFRKGE